MLRVRGLRFHARALDRITWRSIPGSVVHGQLGRELLHLSCIYPGQPCGPCAARAACSYGALFASAKPLAGDSSRFTAVPAPYRLTVRPWDRLTSEPGESVTLEILLLGSAVSFLPIMAEALARGLHDGLGRKNRDGERGRLVIERIEDVHSAAFWVPSGGTSPRLSAAIGHITLAQPSCARPWRLQWHTPVRLKQDGSVSGAPGFRTIVTASLRRLGSLMHFYEGSRLDLDFRGLAEHASRIEVDARWQRIPTSRYSTRQKASMQLDGLVGELLLPPDAHPLVPLLRAVEPLGVGKNTTMGFGAFSLHPV